MKGKDTFTKVEANEIRELISQLSRAYRDEQKRIRSKMRRREFYISDFYDGNMSVEKFDDLIRNHIIHIIGQTNLPSNTDLSQQSREVSNKEEVITTDIESQLIDENNFCLVGRVPECAISRKPGLYCFRIENPYSLPPTFRDLLLGRDHNILYIGQASKSLFERCWEEELHHKNPATFFRKVGAILGFRPPKGTLGESGKNFKFSASDTAKIISWMESNLLVNMVECKVPNLDSNEKSLIEKYCPLLNGTYNPKKLKSVTELIKECREIARS